MRSPKLSHVDLVVSSIERSLPFYRGLLEPVGWTGLREVRGERGETIFYLSVPGAGVAALGLRQKQSGATTARTTATRSACTTCASTSPRGSW